MPGSEMSFTYMQHTAVLQAGMKSLDAMRHGTQPLSRHLPTPDIKVASYHKLDYQQEQEHPLSCHRCDTDSLWAGTESMPMGCVTASCHMVCGATWPGWPGTCQWDMPASRLPAAGWYSSAHPQCHPGPCCNMLSKLLPVNQ